MATEKIISRIQKLMALAEHANTSDTEREAFLDKADELMARHMVDEALLRQSQSPEERRTPVTVEVQLLDQASIYTYKMRTVAEQMARTVGVRIAFKAGRQVLVGYSEDVSWMQILFTNAQLTFLSRVSPKWDAALTVEENVAQLRESGKDWYTVNCVGYRAGAWTRPPVPGEANHIVAMYQRHCKATGAVPVKIYRHDAYRNTFAEAFISRICSRLETMREARFASATEPGTGLALRQVQEDVDAAFYAAFPNLNPEAREARIQAQRDADARMRAEEQERLAAMTPAARLRHERQQAEQRARDARLNAKYWRRDDAERSRRYDGTGARAGTAAADAVNLSTDEGLGRTGGKALR